MSYTLLQEYWWLLVSVLGALLVFMLFVQGGQTMLWQMPRGPRRQFVIACMGHKWELTFTTLVMFGGALFASFPLFYSTSFGGAYWLWILILFSFVVQAVSYEFRRRQGNVYGVGTYDTFLFVNGLVGCLLLGVAVGIFFFGGDFTVTRGNIVDAQAPVISQWGPGHGFEAICDVRCLLLGVMVVFLARTMGILFMMNNLGREGNDDFWASLRRHLLVNGAIFVILFLLFMAVLAAATGYVYDAEGRITAEPYRYLSNYLAMWPAWLALLLGVAGVLYGLARTLLGRRWPYGIWPAGIGVVLVVMSLFWVSGYNDTAFYPSTADMQSSLTIRSASSSAFTLGAMAYVSVIIPFVLAYIVYVWRKMGHETFQRG